MEHESFEDAEVAALLNEHFVSIKVDREERPDVDRVYMTFVQATTGSGGWPMSVWLTPDLKPFYGGTYFPPTSRWGRPGCVDILEDIARVWRAGSEKVRQSAEALTTQLRGAGRTAPGAAVPEPEALERTVAQFRQSFDSRHGGFGDAPKFPRPSELLFLLREFARTGDTGARDMALATLRAMALGGMRDHVGGGFHRYSVDAGWRVPHFEKMLYDQAQLVLAADAGKTGVSVMDTLNRSRLVLFRARAERPRPHLDDKVLTAWNGLMIAAFARMARVVLAFGAEGRRAGQPYLDAARRAAAFVQHRMWNTETATLLRRYRAGYAEIDAYAEDYAFLIFGLLELVQADPDPNWLAWAMALQRRQDELFWDEVDAGWFSTTGRDPSVLLRMKDDYDGAEPTASSVSVMNLLILSHLVEDQRWTDEIDRTLRFFGGRLEQIGRAVPMMAAALSIYTAGPQQIVIVRSARAGAPERAVALRYLPSAPRPARSACP